MGSKSTCFRFIKAPIMHTDILTQIESRLGAVLDDLETVQNLFIEQYPDEFYLQFSAFDAQEKIKAVL